MENRLVLTLAACSLALTSLSGSLAESEIAGETCFAVKVHEISYGSAMHHHVMCGTTTENTKRNITQFLLPLPYHWGNVARKILDRHMSSRGYKEVAIVRDVKRNGYSEPKSFHVFEKNPKNAGYCVAMLSGRKLTGLEKKEVRFDAAVRCDSGAPQKDYSGVTAAELEGDLAKHGEYRKLFTALLPTGNVGYPEPKDAPHDLVFFRNR